MSLLEDLRNKYPEYDDLSDGELAEKYAKKHPNMKQALKEHLLSEKTICVVDSGYFISLARKLSGSFKKVYYCTPTDKEFLSINDYAMGTGFPEIEKIEGYGFMEPEILKEIDCFCFSDIGYVPIQEYLRSIGKPIWGSFGATDLEIFRTKFLESIAKLGMPVAPYKKIKGTTKLIEHLKTVKRKWIKVDRFRKEMETWFHIDYPHSEPELTRLCLVFGGMREEIDFIVQDEIKSNIETGGDLWTIDGKYPSKYFYGFEDKNELYIASLLDADKMPKSVIEINEKLIPLFKEYGFRGEFATEIREVGSKYFFIDPTFRFPGMSGEHQLETCANLAYIIYYGAQGKYIEPAWDYNFAVVASACYCGANEDGWSVVKVPKEIERWVKFSHCCMIDGYYKFPSEEAKDLGVVIGAGKTLIDAFKMLQKNIEALKEEPVYFKTKGFLKLLNSIREAEKKGNKFSNDKLPDDEEILKYIE